MNKDISEYIPSPDEATEHRAPFRLAPPKEDYTQRILQTRQDAFEDTRLHLGARVLFGYLLDLSLRVSSQHFFGSVLISVFKLCQRLGVSKKAIYLWTKQLVAGRYVWVSKFGSSTLWPMNVYHITVLDAPGLNSQRPTRDGQWGNGHQRQQPPAGEGARGKKGNTVFEEKTADLAEITPESRKKDTLPAVNNTAESRKIYGGEPQPLRRSAVNSTAESRKKGNFSAVKKDTCQPSKTPLLRRLKTVVNSDQEVDQGEGSPPDLKKEWKNMLKKLYPHELKELKADLLKQQKQLEPGSPDILDITHRVMEIETVIYGAPTPAAKPNPAKPARKVDLPAPKAMTKAEMLEAARGLVEIGRASMLTAEQKALLADEEGRP